MFTVASACLNWITSTCKSVECERICIECVMRRGSETVMQSYCLTSSLNENPRARFEVRLLTFVLLFPSQAEECWFKSSGHCSLKGCVIAALNTNMETYPNNKLSKMKLLRKVYNDGCKASGKLGRHEKSSNCPKK